MTNESTSAPSSKYWSNLVSRLDPYVPGEQPNVLNLIKLNTNENPYPPSPTVMGILSSEAFDSLRLYPDPNSVKLKQTIADYYRLKVENIFVGNGSDEVLAHAFMTFFNQRDPLLFPDVTYSFYPVYCNLYNIDSIEIPLADDFTLDLGAYKQPNGGIIFPNPNAPTGIGVTVESIATLLQNNTDSVVIIDEAYIDFGGESAVSLVDQYPNLLVVQTLSKSRSLAGARIGFAIGNSDLIAGLDRVKNSFNSYPIDRMGESAAIAAINDETYFKACTDKIINTRTWVVSQLADLGFDILPSQANFIFAKPTKIDAKHLFTQLREKNILVRYFDKPRLSAFLRITIGTDEEMQALVEAIQQIAP